MTKYWNNINKPQNKNDLQQSMTRSRAFLFGLIYKKELKT